MSEQKYIVIVTRGLSRNGYFDRIIKPDAYSIEKYVESLSFGSEIRMVFYDVSLFDKYEQMIDSDDLGKTLTMSPNKSANKFNEEVQAMLEELGIKEKDDDED